MSAHERKAQFLLSRQTRTHYAIKAKRLLGYYVPQNGPVESGQHQYDKMRNDLINARGGFTTRPSAVSNLVTTLGATKNLKPVFDIYCEGSDRRQRATARRIAYRLGYIDKRETEHEIHMKEMAQLRSIKTFEFRVGMDVRAYGSVTVKAKNYSDAVAQVTPAYVADNFEPNGSSDDIDYMNPYNISLFSLSVDEEDVNDFCEIDLPNPDWAPRCPHCHKV